MGARLNAFFDALPRARVQEHHEPWPAFLALGVAGYYVALGVTVLTGLWAGLSLVVLLAVAGACAVSFFVYALARKAVTGRESLVLLEHVWFALAASAAVLWALGEPVLRFLDPAAAGLCFFLAFGRAGCTLVGCCHGPPSSVGIVYPEAMSRDGFNRHLWGVRLFPTQTIELVGLVVLGLVCSALVPFGAAGAALFTFGAGYAVMRFGLESLRFDHRPELLGLSQSRWMALLELSAVAAAVEAQSPSPWTLAHVVAASALGLLLVVALAVKAALAPERHLGRDELAQVRALVITLGASATEVPRLERTKRGTQVAVSLAPTGRVHLSVSARRSAWLGCRVLAVALPEARDVAVSAGGVVHAELDAVPTDVVVPAPREPAAALTWYGAALRAALVVTPPEPARDEGREAEVVTLRRPAEPARAVEESRVGYFRSGAGDGGP